MKISAALSHQLAEASKVHQEGIVIKETFQPWAAQFFHTCDEVETATEKVEELLNDAKEAMAAVAGSVGA